MLYNFEFRNQSFSLFLSGKIAAYVPFLQDVPPISWGKKRFEQINKAIFSK